jgi:hypothetical protein
MKIMFEDSKDTKAAEKILTSLIKSALFPEESRKDAIKTFLKSFLDIHKTVKASFQEAASNPGKYNTSNIANANLRTVNENLICLRGFLAEHGDLSKDLTWLHDVTQLLGFSLGLYLGTVTSLVSLKSPSGALPNIDLDLQLKAAGVLSILAENQRIATNLKQAGLKINPRFLALRLERLIRINPKAKNFLNSMAAPFYLLA